MNSSYNNSPIETRNKTNEAAALAVHLLQLPILNYFLSNPQITQLHRTIQSKMHENKSQSSQQSTKSSHKPSRHIGNADVATLNTQTV